MSNEKDTPTQIEILQNVATENNSSASSLLTQDGRLVVEAEAILKQKYATEYASKEAAERVFSAAMQAHAISTANESLYNQHEYSKLEKLAPNVTNFKFLIKPTETPFIEINREQAYEHLDFLTNHAKKLLQKNESIYAPFVVASNDSLFEQVDIKSELDELVTDLENDNKLLYTQNRKALINNSVCRGHSLPIAIPTSNSKLDIDNGNCDALLTTAFIKGDSVDVLFSYNDYVLVSGHKRLGWIREEDLVNATNVDKTTEHFYTEGSPLFYKAAGGTSQVLLSGDSVFMADSQDSRFSKGISTPQEFLDYIYKQQNPYMWATLDCSASIVRALRIADIQLPAYSGDIMATLLNKDYENTQFTTEDQLRTLDDGIYLADISRVVGEHGSKKDYISDHIYVVTVKDGQFEAWSQAFRLRNGNMTTNNEGDAVPEIDAPMGPYINGIEGILSYMYDKNPRFVRIVKVAE